MRLRLSTSAIQFDNQLCKKESYDFPVVLIGQDVKENKKLNSLYIPIQTLLENCEDNALLILDVVLETWCDTANGDCSTGKMAHTFIHDIEYSIYLYYIFLIIT